MEPVSRRASLLGLPGLALAGAAGPARSRPQVEPMEPAVPIAGGVRLAQGERFVDIVFTAENTVSVTKYPKASPAPPGFFLGPDSRRAAPQVTAERLQLAGVEVRLNRKTGGVAVWFNGRLILEDLGGLDGTAFELGQESDLYGLGQFRDPLVNYRDAAVYLAQGNMDAVNPLLVSPQGYGLLWDTGTDSHFTSTGRRLRFSNPSPVTRYHVLLGRNAEDVIGLYRRLTGPAPLLPRYAYGFWQSQESYRTQDALIEVLDGYRARRLPVDVMVQDWGYWGSERQFSGMVWDPQRYPDPQGLCRQVHDRQARIIASVWPAMGPDSAVYKALDVEGLLLPQPHWSGGRVLDITAPKARAIYWQHIRDGLLSVGLDGLWTDGSEPEFLSTGSRYVTTSAYVGNGAAQAGALRDHALTFSYLQSGLLYREMRRLRPDRRPFTLTRSVYAGQQAFNAVTWSGDTFAGWQTLRNQIIAAQQISLSGIPYWTNDIGGFLVTHRFPGGWSNPAYRELYVRWFQFGAFLPIFRAHGTEIRRELWAIGQPGDPHYEALKSALERRYALLPYIYSLAAKATFDHAPLLRPLVMDFSHDARIQAYPHQYMFGRDLLVCPVTTPLLQDHAEPYEFIPNTAVTGHDGPAASVTFYAGADFGTAVETRLTDDLKMSWFGDLPLALKGKPYSAVWKGRITALESGRHRWRIICQGLVRFTLAGQLKVSSVGQAAGSSNTANGAVSFAGHKDDDVHLFEADLRAGQACDFELTISQPKPDAVSLWVEWITPSHGRDMQVGPDKAIAVYLPAGQDWFRFGKPGRLAGGTVQTLRPAIGDLPLYVRAGAIIPMTPGLQYADEPAGAIELHIYPGRDGTCELYDDTGDGFGYEGGQCSRTEITWDDRTSALTIGRARGQYPGMPTRRSFKAVLYGDQGIVEREVQVASDASATLPFAAG